MPSPANCRKRWETGKPGMLQSVGSWRVWHNLATVHQVLSHFSCVWLLMTPLKPPRLLSPWDFPGKNTGVGCRFLLQGIFPTQGSNRDLMIPALTGVFFTTITTILGVRHHIIGCFWAGPVPWSFAAIGMPMALTVGCPACSSCQIETCWLSHCGLQYYWFGQKNSLRLFHNLVRKKPERTFRPIQYICHEVFNLL